jgi:hypothetical protein
MPYIYIYIYIYIYVCMYMHIYMKSCSPLFADMILYVRDPKKTTKNSQTSKTQQSNRILDQYIKMSSFFIYQQCTDWKRIQENNPICNNLKKYLGINLTKEVKVN